MEMFTWIASLIHAIIGIIVDVFTNSPPPGGEEVIDQTFTTILTVASWYGII